MHVSTAPAPVARGLRVIRVGLLGFGNVGQAVARAAAAAAPRLRQQQIAMAIECALVRDVGLSRRAPTIGRVTSNVEAFLRGRYDAVIDVLPGREPAATIVGRVLGKGIPVISANKALVSADGRRLRRIASRAGTDLRIEACALAGVPFLGAFERRPFASDVCRFSAIVNGTSHFILSRLADGIAFERALAEAQELGYAEPDPSADVSGADALAKLTILAETLLGVALPSGRVDVQGIDTLTPRDLEDARARGGVIKPVVAASLERGGVSAFVAPAFVPASHPLAAVSGRDSAIVIDSRGSGRLVFAGPGAGPDITAATLLDDAIEAVVGGASPAARRPIETLPLVAPETARFGTWRALDA